MQCLFILRGISEKTQKTLFERLPKRFFAAQRRFFRLLSARNDVVNVSDAFRNECCSGFFQLFTASVAVQHADGI